MKKSETKNRLKGFTLVETMTSLVILVILIGVASGVIITTFNIFGKNTVMRMAQSHGNTVYEYLYDHISYATALKIDENVDINNKDSLSSFIPSDLLNNDDSEDGLIKPYYERITVNSEWMSLERKTVDVPVLIYGEKTDADASAGTAPTPGISLNGCECSVKFNYTPVLKDGKNIYPDTIGLEVTISRDGETLYFRSGNIPILNESAREHIDIQDGINNGGQNGINNSYDEFQIFYTYIE